MIPNKQTDNTAPQMQASEKMQGIKYPDWETLNKLLTDISKNDFQNINCI